jgi:cytoskeletal protein CcmA (bactofilin family)
MVNTIPDQAIGQPIFTRFMRSRRGSAFLISMIFLVLLLGIGATFVQMSIQEVARASRIKKETRALALAEAGLDHTTWYIYNYNPSTFPFTLTRTDFPEGSFSATVTQHHDASGNLVPNSFRVVSTGTSQGFTAEVKSVGQLAIQSLGNNAIFDNALFSNSDLTIKGTANIAGTVYCNGNLKAQGSGSVSSDAYAVGTIQDSKGLIKGTKHPGAPHKTMPTIDIQYYRSIADTFYSSGRTFSGTTNLDGVTYIDGPIHLSGKVSGKGVIVVNGDVQVDGSVTLDGTGSEFAIVTIGNVKVNGGSTIDGVIYAHNVSLDSVFWGNGTATVNGAIVADIITVNGTLNVNYKKPTVDLPGASSHPTQVALVSWRRLR